VDPARSPAAAALLPGCRTRSRRGSGSDAETFERLAREAEQGCTMAALVRASAEVKLDTTLEGGRDGS
jgi:hypothetical protein